MTENSLRRLSEILNNAAIPYAYGLWQDPDLPEAWFIGEYSEAAGGEEDGMTEGTLTVTGTSRRYIPLEIARARMAVLFPPGSGRCLLLPEGTGLLVRYSGSYPVPVGEGDLKRLEIRLNIKEWRNA